uniref:Uncharacterized protein n=1 Tax=Siphoviridae sp. ct7Qv4 TaxID=2827786 RepID=A0A8S5SNQ8_9CAUD|nr:MAG TPA: hypothetical protein [Siphoviridae sp. ct7Qv4]
MSEIELTGEAANEAIENDAHVDGEEQQFTPPEGMEAELYDNGALSADKVKERIEALKSEVETAKTNENNMRKKLSTKGTVPDKEEDYAEYEPAEEYKQFYENEEYKEGIEANLKAIDKLAFENGMTKDQCKAVKDAFNKLIVENGLVEDPETQKARNAEFVKAEMEKLGADADRIIKANVAFVKNDNRFNEAEKNLLIEFMDTRGASAVNIVNKMRLDFGGEYAGDNVIPAAGVSDGLPSDTELAREYYNKDTTQARRFEIMQKRIEAGRTGRLPQPDKI